MITHFANMDIATFAKRVRCAHANVYTDPEYRMLLKTPEAKRTATSAPTVKQLSPHTKLGNFDIELAFVGEPTDDIPNILTEGVREALIHHLKGDDETEVLWETSVADLKTQVQGFEDLIKPHIKEITLIFKTYDDFNNNITDTTSVLVTFKWDATKEREFELKRDDNTWQEVGSQVAIRIRFDPTVHSPEQDLSSLEKIKDVVKQIDLGDFLKQDDTAFAAPTDSPAAADTDNGENSDPKGVNPS